MKKILTWLLAACVLAQTTTTTISCFDGKLTSTKDLPQVYGFEVGDTGKEILNKIKKTFIEYNITLSEDEYDVFLKRNSNKKLIQNEDILMIGDIIRIEAEDETYLPCEVWMEETRIKLEEVKIDLNQSISISELKSKIKSLLDTKISSTNYLVDYNVILNGLDLQTYNDEQMLLEGDNVEIKAISTSKLLAGKNSYTVKIMMVDLSKLDINIAQGKSYENISKTLTNLMKNWGNETEISIMRGTSIVDFNEKYISIGKDKIIIKAKENSLLYKGILEIVIEEKFYDNLVTNLGTFSGIGLNDLKKTIVTKLNDTFSKNEIDFIIQETDITFENEPEAFIEKDTIISYSVSFLGAKLFNSLLSTYIIGLENFFFEPYQKWTNAKNCLDSLQNQLQEKYAILEISNDFEVYAIYNDEQVILESDFDPYALGWTGIFNLKIIANDKSKYVVQSFIEKDIFLDLDS